MAEWLSATRVHRVHGRSFSYDLITWLQVHKKLGNTHLALINFSWATDLDPKGTNNHIKEALDKRCMVDDDDADVNSSDLCMFILWPVFHLLNTNSNNNNNNNNTGDHNCRRLQRDHLPFPAVICGFAKGELTRSRFRTRSQWEGLPVATSHFPFLTSIFSACGFVFVGEKYNDDDDG